MFFNPFNVIAIEIVAIRIARAPKINNRKPDRSKLYKGPALNDKASAKAKIMKLKTQLPRILPYAALKFFLWQRVIVAVISGREVATPRNNAPPNVEPMLNDLTTQSVK